MNLSLSLDSSVPFEVTRGSSGSNNTSITGWINWTPVPEPKDNLRLAQDYLMPKKVIYNGRTTIVIWQDETKTISTCSKEEIFDEEIGFAMCLLKKLYGKKVYGKRLYKRIIAKAERQNKVSNVVLEPPTVKTISENLKLLNDLINE